MEEYIPIGLGDAQKIREKVKTRGSTRSTTIYERYLVSCSRELRCISDTVLVNTHVTQRLHEEKDEHWLNASIISDDV